MIAITGANGNLGQATIQFLLQKVLPTDIIAIVRNPEKLTDSHIKNVTIRKADYNNQQELEEALKRVTTLLQISTTSTGETGKRQEKNVVLAAKAMGVKRIVYTSSLTPKSNAHFLATHQAMATEQEILKSDLDYTFLRNSLYMEVIPGLIGNAMETKEIRYPSGDGRVSFVSRLDIAEAIANILTGSEHDNQIYEITGDTAYSFTELAQLISIEKKCIKINHTDISEKVFREELISYQIPVDVADLLVSMANGIKSGEFSYVDRALEKLLDRKPLALAEYIKSL
ncbi:MAG TPA: SDR family oxidoreductase [Sphingobacterium sp.]|nr:SDR family oxidoreductase [Sphingobacterium sp.]